MPERYEVGKLVNTHGIKGEVKIYPYVDYIEDLKIVYIGDERWEIEKARPHKNVYIVKLKNLDDINDAERLKNKLVTVNSEDMPELEEGHYYYKDLIGFNVITDEGKNLGKLDDIFNTGANDIYQIGEILLPGIPEVIKQIDIENNRIIVHILKGLI